MVTNCEFCAFYVYDDDGYAECDVNLDEDEMARFLGSSYQSCLPALILWWAAVFHIRILYSRQGFIMELISTQEYSSM